MEKKLRNVANYFSKLTKATKKTLTKTSGNNAPFIFVSIASYRDNECHMTLNDLFTKARYPNRIVVGLCQQNDPKQDLDCLHEFKKKNPKRAHQIRIIRLAYSEAKGPTWARYLASTLWQGEEYFLQLDSHMRFLPNWDEKLIDMVKKAPIKRAIITHYPPKYDPETQIIDENYETTVPIFGHPYFNEHGVFRVRSTPSPKSTKLQPTFYSAAGMMFGSSQILSEVPFDPHLPFLFNGEEILFTIRAYAEGWRFYIPTENVCFHYYTRAKASRTWIDIPEWISLEPIALQRLRYILGIPQTTETLDPMATYQIDKYNISNKAGVLSRYRNEFGIDLINKIIVSTKLTVNL